MPAQATITLQYGVSPESTDPHTEGYLTGLAANENFLLTVEPGRSFLHRVVYPENANYVYDGYPGGVNDAVRLSGFPGLMDSGPATPVPVQDWEGQPIQFSSLTMVAVQVRPKVLYEATASSGTLSSSGTDVADGDTVTIGGQTYRFKDVMAAAYDVKRHGTAVGTLGNLSAAINEMGTPGVEYFAGTVAHPDVQSTGIDGNTLNLVARAKGVAGDAIPTTDTSPQLTFGAPTLTGGSDTSAILRGLEGTVTIEIDGDLLPGAGSAFKTTVNSPCLFTFATREAWAPGIAGAIRIRFATSLGAPADAQDINALATFMFIGTPS